MLKQIGECIKQPFLNKRGRLLELTFKRNSNYIMTTGDKLLDSKTQKDSK